MDETTRCLEVLGLKPGASLQETKKAYRELLMVWHPDRFASDSPLHAKGSEKVKELNAAYEFLIANGFKDGQPVTSEQPPAPPADNTDVEPPQASAEPSKHVYLWLFGLIVIAAAAISGLLFQNSLAKKRAPLSQAISSRSTNLTQSPNLLISNSATTSTSVSEITAPVPGSTAVIDPGDLYSLRPVGTCAVITNRDGLLITGEGNFLTRDEYRPPFVIRTSAKTDLTNIRLVFGKGVVILNWEMNPDELRFHDPATGGITAVPGQGKVRAEQWQEIEWEVQTNFTVIRVNGQQRARFERDYSRLEDLVGFHTINGVHVSVRRFEVQPLAANPAPPIDLKTGLVLYLPFDADGKDRAADYSGFGNHGKAQGATFEPHGKVGGALLLRGGSKMGSRIVVEHSASLVAMQKSRQFTICAWLKPNSLPEKYPVIIAKAGPVRAGVLGGFECFLSSTGNNEINLISGNSKMVTRDTKSQWLAANLGQWFHLAVVVNAARRVVKVYVNGQRTGDEAELGQDWASANFASLGQLDIGGPEPTLSHDRAWFDGLIDEVRVYSRALPPEAIRQLPGFDK